LISVSLTQTRRHSRILALMGVRNVLLAVNKMDLVNWSKDRFDAICDNYHKLANELGLFVHAVPLSAITGDNVTLPSALTPWFEGRTLLQWLEDQPQNISPANASMVLPVQMAIRPDASFRGYTGTLAQGHIISGDPVRVLPSGMSATVREVRIGFDAVHQAEAGDAVCITLDEERDVSRGDVIAAVDLPIDMAEQFHAHVVWLDAHALIPGRPYWLKLAHCTVGTSVTSIRHLIDPDSGVHRAAHEVPMNGIASVHLSVDRPIPYMPYAQNKVLGGFILIDRMTQVTAGAGMIDFALRRDHNLYWQKLDVDQAARAALKRQAPKCIWFTGLSGSGKSTLANLLEKRLQTLGKHTYVLDGDNVRQGLNRDLGFTEADRAENIRRVAEVSRLMVDAGIIVIVAFISPYRAEREFARHLFQDGQFIEVFVDTPLEECERRDPKGLYAKARRGEIPGFTGVDAPYEPPTMPEIRIDGSGMSPDESAAWRELLSLVL
jgi:bifunctional enzyme CysN/CysC